MPNFIKIGGEIREKSRDAGELERKIRKYNKKKKKKKTEQKQKGLLTTSGRP